MESPEFDAAVVSSDMLTITSRFSTLNPQVSPISTEIVDRVVVESPVSDVAPVVDSDMLPVRAGSRRSALRGRRCRTCRRCNCHLIGCDWTLTWMLSICSLCLRRLRDPACIPSVTYFVTGVTFVVCITGCGLSAGRGG